MNIEIYVQDHRFAQELAERIRRAQARGSRTSCGSS